MGKVKFDKEKQISDIFSDESDPFSQEKLNVIFKISPKKPDRLTSRESGIVEFKESFGWASLPDYLKTCASFANAKGGYIVFGVKDKPHILLGLTEKNLGVFECLEQEKLTGSFNDYFSPEIKWTMHTHEFNNKKYGLIFTFECKNKPVICRRNHDSKDPIKEGDIYYRYRARSERIKYPELKAIIDNNREEEKRLWLKLIASIATIDAKNVGLIDLKTGIIQGESIGTLLIDESLLNKISFIKEGEFSEISGKPTLKLIGEIEKTEGKEIVHAIEKVPQNKAITYNDIITNFLDQKQVDETSEFIKVICNETTSFSPIYYYMCLSKMNKNQIIKELEKTQTRTKSKNKLIERLEKDLFQQKEKPKSDKDSSKKRQNYISEILAESVDSNNINKKDIGYCLESIRMLQPIEIRNHNMYICDLLKNWFNRYYSSADSTLADNLRRAICWVDEAMYAEKLQ